MKPTISLSIAAAVASVFASLMLALPGKVLEGFGAPPHDDGIVVAREVGGLYVALAYLFIAARRWTGVPLMTALRIGVLSQLISIVINSAAVGSGQIAAAALPGVAIHVFVAVVLALGLFRSRNVAPQT